MEPLSLKVKVPYIPSSMNLNQDVDKLRQNIERMNKQRTYFEKLNRVLDENEQLMYPFRTGNSKIQKKPHITDVQYTKQKKKLSKPNFSPQIGCWEMDIMDARPQLYLVMININTRYLIVQPIKSKSTESVASELELMKMSQDRISYPINVIKSDGEASFPSAITKVFGSEIVHIVDTSPYTYHNKTVDAVIRTLRNALGENNQVLISNPIIMQQLVYHYNYNKEHKFTRITPAEFHGNIDAEYGYIEMMKHELKKINSRELLQPKLTPGTIVMVHLSNSKTSDKFKKRRRNYNVLAIFLEYEGTSAIVTRLTEQPNPDGTINVLKVPTFSVQFICRSLTDIYQNGSLTPIGEQIKHTFNLSITPK